MYQARFVTSSDLVQGAHRLTLRGAGPVELWRATVSAMERRIVAARVGAGWDPAFVLDVVGSDVAAGSATVYLAGSVEGWRAQQEAGVGVPALNWAGYRFTEFGGRVDAIDCETRRLDVSGYDRVVGACAWPWSVARSGDAVRHVQPHGTVTHGQLIALAQLLASMVGPDVERTPGAAMTAFIVIDGGVRAAAPMGATVVLEALFLWWQLCWVDLDGITFDP